MIIFTVTYVGIGFWKETIGTERKLFLMLSTHMFYPGVSYTPSLCTSSALSSGISFGIDFSM